MIGDWPDFIIAGVQRGGTTFLHSLLSSYPGIAMSNPKEINYFTFNYDRGPNWYKEHFTEPTVVNGEASPLYYWYPEARQRLISDCPEAYVILLLRDPVERAYSNYCFNITRGLQDPLESFGEAISTARGRRRYIEKGMYAAHIRPLAAHYGKTRLKMVASERLFRKPEEVVREIVRFVGGDESRSWSPASHGRNASLVPRSASVALTRYWLEPLRRLASKSLPRAIRRTLVPVQHWLRVQCYNESASVPSLPDTVRTRLVELYEHDVRRLREELEFSESHWWKNV